MKTTSWILFGLAVALLLGVGAMVVRQVKQTPSEHFQAIEKRASEGYQDREQLIGRLDQVLDRAVDIGDVELGTRVQLKRGRVLMDLGAFERAREDLTAVAAARPGDASVESDLAELEARSGDFHAAQERVARMIQRDPGNTSAYVRLGRLHQQAAERTVARTLELLSISLVPEHVDRARAVLEHSSALLPGDPRRVALSQELRDLLAGRDDTLLENAINATDQACAELDHAREAYTRSLERSIDPEALAGLIGLYERAGKTVLGVDLGTATVRIGALRTNPAFGRALLAGLVELGRLRYAADLAAGWVKSQAPISPEFAAECCVVLYQTKRWQDLQAGSGLLREIGNTSQIQAANLYLGLAYIEQGLFGDGRQYLHYFCGTELPDPFPKARAVAWQYIARACRQLGEPILERTALQGLVDLAPELDPDAWLRLAELQMAAPHGGYREPEMRYAYGMSLSPERTSELLPRWYEIGVLELRSVGMDLAAVRASVLELLDHELRERAIAVRVQGQAPRVRADPVALEQIVHNLVGNAMQALQDVPAAERHLVLALEAQGTHAALSVRDNGPGIAEDLWPRLFEPFVTTRSKGQGLGLGLSLCRSLAQSMGGSLDASPLRPRGVEFKLALPVAD